MNRQGFKTRLLLPRPQAPMPECLWGARPFTDRLQGRLGGSVERPDCGSGRDLAVRGFEPRLGLCADSSEPGARFGSRVSLPLCPFPRPGGRFLTAAAPPAGGQCWGRWMVLAASITARDNIRLMLMISQLYRKRIKKKKKKKVGGGKSMKYL